MNVGIDLDNAYAHCMRIAKGHYENFPVASLLLPKHLRPHVAAVYAFARGADDIVDEGMKSPDERLAELHAWRSRLDDCLNGDASDPVFIALKNTIRLYGIAPQLFHDLLDAFEQDVVVDEYECFADLLDYCRRSANPIGRIMLVFFDMSNDSTRGMSDALCTGLQLVNFWQDVSLDSKKPRLYIPLDSLRAHDLTADDILHGSDSDRTRACIAELLVRTRTFFTIAKPLPEHLSKRAKLELRAIWMGGMRIIEKIEKQRYNVLQIRPVISIVDYFLIVFRALLKGPEYAGS